MAPSSSRLPTLSKLDPSSPHVFVDPAKRIRVNQDINTFLCSRAYADIMTFLQQLNCSMVPCKYISEDGPTKVRTWPLNSKDIVLSEPVQKLRELLDRLGVLIDETPPSTGPRRFGNVAFRDWQVRVEERMVGLFSTLITPRLNPVFLERKGDGENTANAETELHKYLMGSLGSAQRLDYGTGHELSFLAFLGALWKLGYFEEKEYGVEERGIVVGVIEPYLKLMRRLIKTYTLEPAGSHGVWGLDDHFFLPYIFGSAQLCPAVTADQLTPVEGSIRGAPQPSAVVKQDLVDMERDTNMYFSAVGFIYDVKQGPFWEHSPILFDISGIKDGWGKINKGMIKMHNAEVLSKFPVVQHFPIGSLFRWERDPLIPATCFPEPPPQQQQQQQQSHPASQSHPHPNLTKMHPPPTAYTQKGIPMTAAPWASQTPRPDAPNFPKARPLPPTTADMGTGTGMGVPMTAASWATQSPRGRDAQMLSQPSLRSVYPPAASAVSGAGDRADSTVSGIRKLDIKREDGGERDDAQRR